MENKLAFSVEELCSELTIGRTRLYQLVSNGQLKARKLGRRTVFLKSDVDAYLNSLPSKETDAATEGHSHAHDARVAHSARKG